PQALAGADFPWPVDVPGSVSARRPGSGGHGRQALLGLPLAPLLRPLALPAVLAFGLADALDGHHLLALGRPEDANALGRTAGEADAVHRHADELAAVGDE